MADASLVPPAASPSHSSLRSRAPSTATPLFTSGIIQINIGELTEAIAWLSSLVQHEQEARCKLEAVVEASLEATKRACEAAGAPPPEVAFEAEVFKGFETYDPVPSPAELAAPLAALAPQEGAAANSSLAAASQQAAVANSPQAVHPSSPLAAAPQQTADANSPPSAAPQQVVVTDNTSGTAVAAAQQAQAPTLAVENQAGSAAAAVEAGGLEASAPTPSMASNAPVSATAGPTTSTAAAGAASVMLPTVSTAGGELSLPAGLTELLQDLQNRVGRLETLPAAQDLPPPPAVSSSPVHIASVQSSPSAARAESPTAGARAESPVGGVQSIATASGAQAGSPTAAVQFVANDKSGIELPAAAAQKQTPTAGSHTASPSARGSPSGSANLRALESDLMGVIEKHMRDLQKAVPAEDDIVSKVSTTLRGELQGWLAGQRAQIQDDQLEGSSVTAVPQDEDLNEAFSKLRDEIHEWLESQIQGLHLKTSNPPSEAGHADTQEGEMDALRKAVEQLRQEVMEKLHREVAELSPKGAAPMGSAGPELNFAQPADAPSLGAGYKLSADIAYSAETPPPADIEDAKQLFRWVQTELGRLHRDMQHGRQESNNKMLEALREEMNQMLSNAMKGNSPTSPGAGASPVHFHQTAETAPEVTGPAAAEILSEDFAGLPPNAEKAPEATSPGFPASPGLPRQSSSPQAPSNVGDITGIKNALVNDDMFIGRLLAKLDGTDEEIDKAPELAETALGDGKDATPKASHGSHGEGRRGLDGRLTVVEEALEKLSGIADGSSVSLDELLHMRDNIRRLNTRFEYLERIVPPDVQRALNFFEPLREATPRDYGVQPVSPNTAASAIHSKALMRKIDGVRDTQMSYSERAQVAAEDGRREVANVSMALRGVQREGEAQGAKLDDLRKKMTKLHNRIEAALPQLAKTLEEVLQRVGSGNESDNSAIEGLKLLVSEADEPALAPHPFVSHKAMSSSLTSLHGDVQAGLKELREELANRLNNKADLGALQHIAEQLARLDQQSMPLLRTLYSSMGSQEQVSGDASFMRYPTLQGRCASCDSKVDLKFDSNTSTWPGQQRGSTPAAGRNAVNLRPLQRNVSSPGLSGPGTRPGTGMN